MADHIDVTVPAGQSEGTESYVSTWFKSVGDAVTENEPLLEISTDKVNMEVAAPGSGTLSEILKSDGEQVQPGEVLGRITVGESAAANVAAEAPPKPSAQADGTEKPVAAASPGGSGDLSPAVRRLLKEHDVDPALVTGTGRGGRITHDDVMKHVESRKGATSPAQSPKKSAIPGRSVPHTPMRKSIAHHMAQSVATAPHVTSVFEADMSAVIAARDAARADFESRGIKLTYTAYFVRATVEAMKAVPEVNSRWFDDRLEIFDDVNIGIATALGRADSSCR